MNGTINVRHRHRQAGQQNAVERCQGYEEQLKNYANATIVDEQVGSWNRDSAMAIAENWITSGRDIDIILSTTAPWLSASLLPTPTQTLSARSSSASAVTEEGLTAILNGDFDGTVFQPAYQERL